MAIRAGFTAGIAAAVDITDVRHFTQPFNVQRS
jgi:hypothetical protein